MPIFRIFGKADKERQSRLIKGFFGGNLVFEIVRDLYKRTDRHERKFYPP